MEKHLQDLNNLFHGRDWFHSIETDQYGRFVLYVNYMGSFIWKDVPDTYKGKQVFCHFAVSKITNDNKFIVSKNISEFHGLQDNLSIIDGSSISDKEFSYSFLDDDLSNLCKELDRLERFCGLNVLESIFYEEHDGPNAVTNLSDKYPYVRKVMGQLYEEYGFDVICGELDG